MKPLTLDRCCTECRPLFLVHKHPRLIDAMWRFFPPGYTVQLEPELDPDEVIIRGCHGQIIEPKTMAWRTTVNPLDAQRDGVDVPRSPDEEDAMEGVEPSNDIDEKDDANIERRHRRFSTSIFNN